MLFSKILVTTAMMAVGAGAAYAQSAIPATPATPATPASPAVSAPASRATPATPANPVQSVTGRAGANVGIGADVSAAAHPPADGHDDPAVSRLPGVVPGAGVNTSPVGTSTSSPGGMTDGGAPTGRDAERDRK